MKLDELKENKNADNSTLKKGDTVILNTNGSSGKVVAIDGTKYKVLWSFSKTPTVVNRSEISWIGSKPAAKKKAKDIVGYLETKKKASGLTGTEIKRLRKAKQELNEADWLNDYGNEMDKKAKKNKLYKLIAKAQENPQNYGIDVDPSDWSDDGWMKWALNEI